MRGSKVGKDKELKDVSSLSYEEAIAELEEITQLMSQGKLSLQESLETYERGVGLSKRCRELLEHAQKRVRELDGELVDIQEEDLRNFSSR
jgi:exodeoxyribonuclease VII small subunit